MMKLTSTNYSAGAFNIAMLILRLGLGIMMVPTGYDKLVNFATYKKDFLNFLGMGGTVSLGLLVFAEFFCASLVILGLFTRLAAAMPFIAMTVAVVEAHKGLVLGEGQHAALFALGFLIIVILGPGKISVDAAFRR